MNHATQKIRTRFFNIVLKSLFFIVPSLTHAQQVHYNIQNFGAKGNDKTVNTAIINHAIDKCFHKGGGTVIVAKGVFLTSTIYLKSNVNIRLEKGAVLKAVSNINLYHPFIPKTDLSKYSTISATGNNGNSAYDTVWTKALVIGESVSNVTISGEGTIDGEHVFNAKGEEGMRGPHTIILANCSNIKFEGILIEKAANYALLAYNPAKCSFPEHPCTARLGRHTYPRRQKYCHQELRSPNRRRCHCGRILGKLSGKRLQHQFILQRHSGDYAGKEFRGNRLFFYWSGEISAPHFRQGAPHKYAIRDLYSARRLGTC
jgi:hypothetical protein